MMSALLSACCSVFWLRDLAALFALRLCCVAALPCRRAQAATWPSEPHGCDLLQRDPVLSPAPVLGGHLCAARAPCSSSCCLQDRTDRTSPLVCPSTTSPPRRSGEQQQSPRPGAAQSPTSPARLSFVGLEHRCTDYGLPEDGREAYYIRSSPTEPSARAEAGDRATAAGGLKLPSPT